jgi:hypothetical protein
MNFMKVLKYGILIFAALLAATTGIVSCGSRGGTLASITVTPADPTIAIGTKQQFAAIATFTDGTTLVWTSAANWTTSDNSAVTISNSFDTFGLATSLVTGTTTTGTFTITATDTANHISGTAMLTVVDPISITITPNDPFMAKNTTHQFTAIANLTSGSTTTITQNLTSSPTLSWIVDNTVDNTTATISSTGLVTSGTITGTATIKAFDIYSSSTPTATTTLTITNTSIESIAITPIDAIISMGTTTQFSAKGTFKDGTPTPDLTSSVIWHSSNTGVATISNEALTYGLATAVVVTGVTSTTSTTIRATDPITGDSNSTTLYVTP